MFEQIINWTQKHVRFDGLLAEEDMFRVCSAMYAVYMGDAEFWGNQSLWKLYDAANGN